MKITAPFVRERIDVDCLRSQIDDGRSRDPHFRNNRGEAAVTISEIRSGRGGGRAEIDLPQNPARCPELAVAVQRINAVVFRSHENHVARAFAGNSQAGNIKWLGVNEAVHTVTQNFAKRTGVDIGGGEEFLAEILPITGVVVMIRQDIHLPENRTAAYCIQKESKKCVQPPHSGRILVPNNSKTTGRTPTKVNPKSEIRNPKSEIRNPKSESEKD